MELMRTTMTLSASLNVSPFEIFEQDTDEIIMLINFYIRLDGNSEEKAATKKVNRKRIKVNDKTATGGWF